MRDGGNVVFSDEPMSSIHTHYEKVTGAAQGFGRAIALRLARDGLNVAVSDIPAQQSELEAVAQDIKAQGRASMAVQADVRVEKDLNNMVETVADKLGGLDVMVANAGVTVAKPFLDTPLSLRSISKGYSYATRPLEGS